MGQKVNPHGLRVGIIKSWDSQWYAENKDFADNLVEDNKIRKYLKKNYYNFAISRIQIKKVKSGIKDILTITIHTGKPGALIGREGSEIEKIKKGIRAITDNKPVNISIVDVKKPDANAQLLAERIAADLERRQSFRRAMKTAMMAAKKSGVKGIKTVVSGRLDGAEIARSEKYHEGSIPLQTLRADIDYGFAEAHTTFGIIGVKVWIYNGEVLTKTSLTDDGGKSNVNA